MNINKATTASFDVDAQNGFTPVCPDELPVEDGCAIVPALNVQSTYASLRVGSQDAHPANAIWAASDENPSFSAVEGDDVDIRWNMHCVPGTKGFELINGLPPVTDYDFMVFKGVEPTMHPYGACYHDLNDKMSTGIIEFLKTKGVETVLCGGLATEYCLKLTALQLADAGFKVIVNLSACRAINNNDVEQAILEMKAKGVVVVNDCSELSLNDKGEK